MDDKEVAIRKRGSSVVNGMGCKSGCDAPDAYLTFLVTVAPGYVGIKAVMYAPALLISAGCVAVNVAAPATAEARVAFGVPKLLTPRPLIVDMAINVASPLAGGGVETVTVNL